MECSKVFRWAAFNNSFGALADGNNATAGRGIEITVSQSNLEDNVELACQQINGGLLVSYGDNYVADAGPTEGVQTKQLWIHSPEPRGCAGDCATC
jgi:hypothetical protein